MKQSTAKASAKPAVLSLAQLLAEQPPAPPPGWIEPGLLPPSGILFVGGEPKVGKSLLVANLALALAAGKDRAGFTIPAARRFGVNFLVLSPESCSFRIFDVRRAKLDLYDSPVRKQLPAHRRAELDLSGPANVPPTIGVPVFIFARQSAVYLAKLDRLRIGASCCAGKR